MNTLKQELEHLEQEIEKLRQKIERLSPLPVYWKSQSCGRKTCNRCPHGPYPYLKVKKGKKWRWQYLGKGWQPPEGFIRPSHFKELLAKYRELIKRRESLLELLESREV